MLPEKSVFPPIFKGEKVREYVKRCMNMNSIAKEFPNRKDRKIALETHFRSVPIKRRHGWYSPDKYLFAWEAAEFLGINEVTLRQWVQKKWITPGTITTRGKKFRVYYVEVLKQIKEVRDEIIAKKSKSNSD